MRNYEDFRGCIRPHGDPSLAQAIGMEAFSGIEISQELKEEYARRRVLEADEGLSDQRLLADVIACLNPENLLAFYQTYPQIFEEELENIENIID